MRDLSSRRLQLRIVILCSQLVHLQQGRPEIRPLLRLFGILLLWKLHPRSLGEKLQCLRKRVILIFHNKCKHIAARTAAKAIIHLLIPAYGKRRRFLIVERTQPEIGASLLLKLHISRYYVHNIIFHSNFFYNLIRIIHEIFTPSWCESKTKSFQ